MAACITGSLAAIFLLQLTSSLAQDCNTDADCSSGQFCSGSSSEHTPSASTTFTLNSNRTFTNNTFPDRFFSNFPPVTSTITIFGKVRQQPDNNGFLLAKGLDAIQRDYGLYLRSAQRQIWFIFNTVEADQNPDREQRWETVIKTDLSVADGNWHTVAVAFSPVTTRVEFFIDGVLRAVELATKRPDYNTIGPDAQLWVGGRPRTLDFNFVGDIEIARIYTVALTEAQVLQVHREAMNTAVRQCVNYQDIGQVCDLCGTASCVRRCNRPTAVCVANPVSRSTPLVVPVVGQVYIAPALVGTCQRPCNCTTAASDVQVCGADGLTYRNRCFAMCANQTVLQNGQCPSFAALANGVYTS